MAQDFKQHQYVLKNGKKLRRGYTTGACAAAAAKGAVLNLLDKAVSEVSVETPSGIIVTVKLINIQKRQNECECGVIKDAGDDPDVTHGLEIRAKAKLLNQPEVRVKGGKGIGKVTQPGLPVPVGQPAINPVPMQMIKREVKKVLPDGIGAEITISVPGGEEVAKKTFNPRLGIEGGISIIGTTGIVEPMSEEALKSSLSMTLDVMKARKIDRVVLVFGNYGRDFATKTLKIHENYIAKTSNFVGFMLDECGKKGFNKILLIGHLGKIVKVAGGIFETHSKKADARMEILCAHLALMGCRQKIIQQIMKCNTTEGAAQLILESNMQEVFNSICEAVVRRLRDRFEKSIELGCMAFSMKHGLLGKALDNKELLEEFKK